jgi:hypothetical protein
MWELISRKLAGEATEEMLAELDDILLKHPDLQYIAGILFDLFQTTSGENKMDEEAAFERHLKKMEQKQVNF